MMSSLILQADQESFTFSLKDIAASLAGKQLNAATAAWLLCSVPNRIWSSFDELTMLVDGVQHACQITPLPCAAVIDPAKPRGDSRLSKESILNCSYDDEQNDIEYHDSQQRNILKVYTEYDIAKEFIQQRSRYHGDTTLDIVLVESLDEAQFLLTTAHISQFLQLSKELIVCQFPYEGGFVRKVTIRSRTMILIV